MICWAKYFVGREDLYNISDVLLYPQGCQSEYHQMQRAVPSSYHKLQSSWVKYIHGQSTVREPKSSKLTGGVTNNKCVINLNYRHYSTVTAAELKQRLSV